MILAGFLFNGSQWLGLALGLVVVSALLVWYGLSVYRSDSRGMFLPAILKMLAMSLIAFCLAEPIWSSVRTRPGANLFLLLVDNSASLQMADAGAATSRGDQLKSILSDQQSGWQARLGQEFDVRAFAVASRLEALSDFSSLQFSEPHSSWYQSLKHVKQRFADRPVAGIFLFTDGIASDEQPGGWSSEEFPPIYPVVWGDPTELQDVSIENVALSTTAFEDAPVTITAEVKQSGVADREVVARLLDDRQSVVKEETLRLPKDGRPTSLRFQIRPTQPGLCFYTLKVEFSSPDDGLHEVTTVNNERLIAVDRGSGPYRILYLSGRPNWEYKFLNRALETDEQVKMTSVIRIAKREPKFDWRGRAGESSNPLFRGFDGIDAETERFDQPVFVRLNTQNETELRDGFPKLDEELFPFLAVIIDDLEAEFFTTAQLELLERYVSERGGSLLMLGGMESFVSGGYRKTPLARVLPISLDETEASTDPLNRRYKLSLTREGWLQPWARLRSTEDEELQRLKNWPEFHTVNSVGREKPGATVIAEAVENHGEKRPAVVAHRYGEGRCAAVLIGDLWRAQLQQLDEQRTVDDLGKAWRQLVRWLIADVPERIELRAAAVVDDPAVMRLEARIKTTNYQPQDNSQVVITATLPDDTSLKLPAEPSLAEAGLYESLLAVTQPGAYRAEVHVTDEAGQSVGTGSTGWVHAPSVREFRRVSPDRSWLDELAKQTGGDMVNANRLAEFVQQLTRKPAPITETSTTPLWQNPLVLALILIGLCGEWAMRRWRGLP